MGVELLVSLAVPCPPTEVGLDHVEAPLRVGQRVDRPVARQRAVVAAWARALVVRAGQVRHVRVDARLQALAVEVVREVRQAVRELHGVRLHDVRHRVARALGHDALLHEHVLEALVAQARRDEGVRDLAEEGVVVVAAEEVPVRKAHRRRERRAVAPGRRQRQRREREKDDHEHPLLRSDPRVDLGNDSPGRIARVLDTQSLRRWKETRAARRPGKLIDVLLCCTQASAPGEMS